MEILASIRALKSGFLLLSMGVGTVTIYTLQSAKKDGSEHTSPPLSKYS